MRGFVNLDNISISEQQKGFFEYQDKNYFFKRCKNDWCYRELIAHEIATFLNIHSIFYKPAFLINQCGIYDKGVISLDYRSDDLSYISGYDILKDYYDDYLGNWLKEDVYNNKRKNNYKYNNIESIYKALIHRFSFIGDGEQKADYILKFIIKEIFLFDIFTQNSDRHFKNWEIVENINTNQIMLNALFDNEDIFLDYQSTPKLKCSNKGSTDWYDELKELLLMTDNEYLPIVKYMFNKLTPEKLIMLIQFTERKHQIIIPLYTKKDIVTKYKEHYEKIGEVIKIFEQKDKKIFILKK